MKKIYSILLAFILLACGESNNKQVQNKANLEEAATQTTTENTNKSTDNSTFLCKINGVDWTYSSSNGIVSRNSSTKVRTATIGFRKQLEKGYESIQLEYDVEANVVNSVLVELKRPNKDGKLITAFYTQYAKHLDKNPEASMSGTVSLSQNDRKASGKAMFTIANKNEKDELANTEDLLISVTDLSFSGINYSDTDDLKKLMKK